MSGPTTTELQIPIEGMTCASCVNRVEKGLQRLDGHEECAVNFAPEKAKVSFDPDRVSTEDLAGAVEAAGYVARVPVEGNGGGHRDTGTDEHDHAGDLDLLRRRVIFSAVLSVPILLMAMIPPLQFDY